MALRLNPNPLHWVWIEYAGTLIALKEYERAKELLGTALDRQEAGTQNTIVFMYLAAISIFEDDIQEATKQCSLAKEITANFDLEQNLKAVSTTTDTVFYNTLTEAIRKACS
jgi:predicted Zn-dependent protease